MTTVLVLLGWPVAAGIAGCLLAGLVRHADQVLSDTSPGRPAVDDGRPRAVVNGPAGH
jgi:hypothetical protein